MTRRLVAQVWLSKSATEAERARVVDVLAACAESAPGVVGSQAGLHLPGSVGGGDLTWDLLFEDESTLDALCERAARAEGPASSRFLGALGGQVAALSAGVEDLIAAIPEPLASESAKPGLVGVKRTLWLETLPDAPADRVRRFEQETPRLAAAVPAIRNWSWSRIRSRAPNPMATRYTHLWEQEFEGREGLDVDYMSSPFHWGVIDRWFDPEMPEQVVDVRLGHLLCQASQPVLSWDRER